MINLRQNLPHALLITGDPDAILQELQADLKILLCENLDSRLRGNDGCMSCNLYESEAGHPDLMTIRPEGKMNITKIDMVREVISFLSQSALRGGMRIVVFTEADTLNIASQNALLKSLEEPGNKTLIILITAKPHLLLPTIKSRCQNIQVGTAQNNNEPLKKALLAEPFNPLTFTEQHKETSLLECVHMQMEILHDQAQKHPTSALFHFYNDLIKKSELLQKKVAVSQDLILFELALAWQRFFADNSIR